MTDSTTDPPVEITSTDVVHVIETSYRFRDEDGRPQETIGILHDEGWFADEASALVRKDQLNDRNRAFYDSAMTRAKREHDARIRAAQTANREAAILRDAGMLKNDVAVPPAFTPVAFEDFVPEQPHTTYAVIQVRRSDHDGIARAAETQSDGRG